MLKSAAIGLSFRPLGTSHCSTGSRVPVKNRMLGFIGRPDGHGAWLPPQAISKNRKLIRTYGNIAKQLAHIHKYLVSPAEAFGASPVSPLLFSQSFSKACLESQQFVHVLLHISIQTISKTKQTCSSMPLDGGPRTMIAYHGVQSNLGAVELQLVADSWPTSVEKVSLMKR